MDEVVRQIVTERFVKHIARRSEKNHLEQLIYNCIHNPACVYHDDHSYAEISSEPLIFECRHCKKSAEISYDLLRAVRYSNAPYNLKRLITQ